MMSIDDDLRLMQTWTTLSGSPWADTIWGSPWRRQHRQQQFYRYVHHS